MDSSAGCTMIFSRRIKRHDLYRIVPAPAIIAGRGGMGYYAVEFSTGQCRWDTHRCSRRVECDVAHRRSPPHELGCMGRRSVLMASSLL